MSLEAYCVCTYVMLASAAHRDMTCETFQKMPAMAQYTSVLSTSLEVRPLLSGRLLMSKASTRRGSALASSPLSR